MDDDLTEYARNNKERAFLRRLGELQPPFCDVWRMSEPLIVTVCVADDDANLILRTLRVDYDGERIVAGNDPTHQIVDDLDPDDEDRFVSERGLDPAALADGAMVWFRGQAERPIERQEWDEGWQRWVLADTGQALTLRRAGGVAWAAGGAWGDGTPERAPDRVVRL